MLLCQAAVRPHGRGLF